MEVSGAVDGCAAKRSGEQGPIRASIFGACAFLLDIYCISIYNKLVIRSFRCAETERIFQGQHSRKLQSIEKTGLRKLIQLNQARGLQDLRSPGNALEALSKERAGQYAIRINERYRLCFVWNDNEASEVEIEDYH